MVSGGRRAALPHSHHLTGVGCGIQSPPFVVYKTDPADPPPDNLLERAMQAVREEKRQPRGIVIQHGAFAPEPAAFWAFLWTEDTEDADVFWHERVPVAHRQWDQRAA